MNQSIHTRTRPVEFLEDIGKKLPNAGFGNGFFIHYNTKNTSNKRKKWTNLI
jgi:hypothetical protein